MAPTSREGRFEEAASILDQLLKYTKQLASFDADPKVNVAALSEACGRRLDDLKQVLPHCLKNSPGSPQLLDKIRDLRDQTQLCTDLLEKEMEKTSNNIQALSKSRKAIGAYRS
ncbi:MAG: flagellar protein FliT [Syntrophobacteraceae bacterium]